MQNQLVATFLSTNSKVLSAYKKMDYDDQSFRASVMMAVAESPKLREAFEAALKTDIGKATLMQALSKAARTGLSVAPSEGKACLIGYNTKSGPVIKYQVMKEGYVQLAMDSGAVQAIRARAVFENDDFKPVYNLGDDKPNYAPTTSNRGVMIGAFAEMMMFDDKIYMIYLTLDEIIHRRDNSDGFKHNPDTSPWTNHFAAMAEKTAMKDLLRKTKTTALHKTHELIDEIEPMAEPRNVTQGASADDVKNQLKDKKPAEKKGKTQPKKTNMFEGE